MAWVYDGKFFRLKQQAVTPLFPDILWSRPETKQGAGKLLIVGGNSFGFAAPGLAFAEATAAGIGVTRVLLPETLRKIVGNLPIEAEFAPTNPSGSFSSRSLEPLLTNAAWADGVLVAGAEYQSTLVGHPPFGRNIMCRRR